MQPLTAVSRAYIIEAVGRKLTALGGKRYPTGWIGYQEAEWRRHYGALWPVLNEWKRRFDPNGVLG